MGAALVTISSDANTIEISDWQYDYLVTTSRHSYYGITATRDRRWYMPRPTGDLFFSFPYWKKYIDK